LRYRIRRECGKEEYGDMEVAERLRFVDGRVRKSEGTDT
jgi:hypothetical protein